jgi:23S rRNA-/tRNA-specific pseudouridylate synthase
VLGDTVYGSRRSLRAERSAVRQATRGRARGDGVQARGADAPIRVHRQLLHASLLELTHPLTGVKVRAESPLPADFRAALERLRQGSQPKKR